MVLRDRHTTSNASVHFLWQAQYFRDLDKKTEVEAWLNLVFHFQCSFFVAHAVFGENETCAVQALYRDLAQGLLVESLHRDLEIVLYRDS